MRIALASAPTKNGDIVFNISSIIDTIAACSGNSDIIMFGETVLQGFDSLSWDYSIDKRIAVSLISDAVIKIGEAARRYCVAVAFGFIEDHDNSLFSSYLFVSPEGNIVDVFRRVSAGWKDFHKTDLHYKEGESFHSFVYGEKRFATALCGDLWTEGRPEEMAALQSDIVLWPIWCDYPASEWNEIIKFEYALQASRCGKNVLLVNPFCVDSDSEFWAAGGSAHFRNGRIICELPAGKPGILYVDI